MSTPPVDYAAVLADLKAKKDSIELAIIAIEGLVSGAASTPGAPVSKSGVIAGNEFFGLSIPDAAKKYLVMVKQKQSTVDIMKALEQGGLPPMQYSTVYAVLRRRQNQVGDIVNLKGDWGLAAWYPNYSFKKAGKNGTDSGGAETPNETMPDETESVEQTEPEPEVQK